MIFFCKSPFSGTMEKVEKGAFLLFSMILL